MMRKIAELKNRLMKIYQHIKDLEEMPLRMIQGEFYEEKKKEPARAPRKNNVSVEDLRPKKESA